MQKVGIFTWHDVKAAYASLFYLQSELEKNYVVDLWGYSAKSDIEKKNYYSLTDTWYGKIRRVRVYLAKFRVFQEMKRYNLIILNDLEYFRMGYYIKKLYPRKKIIHYNTEIHGRDVNYPRHTVSFYEQHADYPDMIIECLKERAAYRKEKFHIDKDIYVINNTLPKKEIEEALLDENIDVSNYFGFSNSLPILIYAGGCNLNRNLSDIIDSAGLFRGRLNYMFFCYGNAKDFAIVEKKCRAYDNCHLYHAVDRKTLLNIMSKCDIGIQYYDPDVSINHYLASPSKFFEYLSVGLNVLSSQNHGVDRIIEENDLGVCFDKTEGIAGGIEKLLSKGLREKAYIKKVFEDKLCYEVDSPKVIAEIERIINVD